MRVAVPRAKAVALVAKRLDLCEGASATRGAEPLLPRNGIRRTSPLGSAVPRCAMPPRGGRAIGSGVANHGFVGLVDEASVRQAPHARRPRSAVVLADRGATVGRRGDTPDAARGVREPPRGRARASSTPGAARRGGRTRGERSKGFVLSSATSVTSGPGVAEERVEPVEKTRPPLRRPRRGRRWSKQSVGVRILAASVAHMFPGSFAATAGCVCVSATRASRSSASKAPDTGPEIVAEDRPPSMKLISATTPPGAIVATSMTPATAVTRTPRRPAVTKNSDDDGCPSATSTSPVSSARKTSAR